MRRKITATDFPDAPIDSLGFGSLGESLGLPESFQTSSDRAKWYYLTAVVILLIKVF